MFFSSINSVPRTAASSVLTQASYVYCRTEFGRPRVDGSVRIYESQTLLLLLLLLTALHLNEAT